VHPVGSYCMDMSRCAVNRTLHLTTTGLCATSLFVCRVASRVKKFLACYEMICSLTAIVLPPGGSGRKNCTQIENKQLYTWGETIQ